MQFSRTELLREKEYRRCRGTGPTDLEALYYFCEAYCRIQHPERGSILIELRPAQREILGVWIEERYSIVLKARQVGWSTIAALYALWLTFFHADRRIVMLSKGEREANELLRKATYAYDRLPQWIKERGPSRTSNNVQKLTFANSSSIESLPSKEDPARGTAVSLVIVDEWAFFENAEDAWASIEPITDVGGRVIGLSTAHGWGDFFHGMWVKATTGVSAFKPMFYPWWANSERNDDWYETKKRTMLEWQLHQEYPSDPDEAFIKSGRMVFDLDVINAQAVETPRRGRLSGVESKKMPTFLEQSHDQGDVRIFEMPHPEGVYVVGADVAEGLEHGDFSCGQVIESKSGRQVAVWHGRIDPDVFGDELALLGYFYHQALIGVEVNNHGLTTNKALLRCSYPRVFFRKTLDRSFAAQQVQVGWYTSVASKPLMIDEVARQLRTGELTVHDSETLAELRTFVRDERGRMGGSPYDDRVVALAIAAQMRQWVSAPEYVSRSEQYWTFDYFKEQVLRDKAKRRQGPIGANNRRGGTLLPHQ